MAELEATEAEWFEGVKARTFPDLVREALGHDRAQLQPTRPNEAPDRIEAPGFARRPSLTVPAVPPPSSRKLEYPFPMLGRGHRRSCIVER